MKNIKNFIFIFIISLILFFNTEILIFSNKSFVDLSIPSIFIILMFITLYSFSSNRESLINYIFPIAFFYSILRAIYNKIFIVEMNSYEYLLESLCILFLTYISYKIISGLKEFEDVINEMVLSGVDTHTQSFDEAVGQIQVQMITSRRHHRPLSIVVVEPELEAIQFTLHRFIKEAQQTLMTRYAFSRMIRVFSRVLRRTDLIVEEDDQNRFIILSPDTDMAGSSVLAERIRATAAEFRVPVKCGTASFPEEAVTLEGLVAKAESQLKRPAVLPGTADSIHELE